MVWLLLLVTVLLSACGASNNGKATSPESAGTADNAQAAAPDATGGAEPGDSGNAAPTEEGASAGELVTLTVSAAASLTDALEELESQFEAAHPNIELQFNFGGSGALRRQLEQGAPADLFLSASMPHMEALVEAGLIAADQQRTLLGNSLVVVVPADAQEAPADLEALTSDAIARVAVGIPESVPAGAYAQEALMNAGVWETLQAKTVQAKDVRQVLQYVETGNVEAGFVYKTDAASTGGVRIAFDVDPSLHAAIDYPAGIVSATGHPEEAQTLYTFLQSDEALEVFETYGFSAAP
ncbi:molybdate ABC transporter substrate-binding protein [Paenibacillus sp. IB182496]|uniref:Molybdate ABC transporter substrate-binding protein n=2 Tax=Paenibacillus sabuli TaxID=2772509 RepID=A0A927GTH9_9BACL|nr:molybdate ABC transporter substrate-binding protein [Paenibacillus sabuli]